VVAIAGELDDEAGQLDGPLLISETEEAGLEDEEGNGLEDEEGGGL
jgi:hypothetical protein